MNDKNINNLFNSYDNSKCWNYKNSPSLLTINQQVLDLINSIKILFFPNVYSQREYNVNKRSCFDKQILLCKNQVYALTFNCESLDGAKDLQNIESLAETISNLFCEKLYELRSAVLLDVQATYYGDPAANSVEEVILTYPGILGVLSYRIAHFFYQQGVSILPRLITEYCHSKTGIDIHPGAIIGHSFCIDHGTGVVIGETAVIKNGVKIYQGVTLGAFSVSKSLKGRKRHPTIEDNVTIYAMATILGGNTVIGCNSIIGGNVWLTNSIPPDSSVNMVQNDLVVKSLK